jgi:hypothetical protein
VGWLIFATLLPDFLLGWFVLAGLESYEAPNDYPSLHYLLFTFPWSHGDVDRYPDPPFRTTGLRSLDVEFLRKMPLFT